MTQLEQLLQVGVLTGSRAFNCATAESDYDIVVLKSDCKCLMNGDIINSTNFNDWNDAVTNNGKAYYDLSEHPEFEDEHHLEYDQHTIWGPLIRIIKYCPVDSPNILINLFVYADKDADILPKFVELNSLINFLYGHEISDKEKRIEAFTKIIKHVGITDF